MLIGISGKIGAGKDLTTRMFQREEAIMLIEEGKMGQFHASQLPSLEELTQDNCNLDNFTRLKNMKFATKLKDFAAAVTGIERWWFDDGQKKKEVLGPEWNINDIDMDKDRLIVDQPMTIRELLIRIGHGCRVQVHPDIWVNALFSDYRLKSTPIRTNEPHDGILKKMKFEEVYPDWIISDMRYPNEKARVEVLQGFSVRINRDNVQLIDHESETGLDDANFDYYIDNNGSLEDLQAQVRRILMSIKAQQP